MDIQFHTFYDWADGSTWVADGGQRVAKINGVRLYDLVLHRGGVPRVTWLTLFWWQYANNEQAGRSAWLLDDIHLADEDPACFRLEVRSHNQGRSVESLCQLTLTYDQILSSYVYNVELTLTVKEKQVWQIEPQGGVEFANPWCREAVGASVPHADGKEPDWRWVSYGDCNGNIMRLPLTHLGAPFFNQIYFPGNGGGWLGFFNHVDGNPVIELDEETAQATRAEVCAWGYDVHFIHRVPSGNRWQNRTEYDEQVYEPVLMSAGEQLRAKYRLYALPTIESERRLAVAKLPELSNKLAQQLAKPAYRKGINSFQDSVNPLVPDSAWFWTASDSQGLIWDRENGRVDDASLFIRNTECRKAFWQVALGPDFWMAPFSQEEQWVRGWIRTESIIGMGAYISFEYSNYLIATGQAQPYEKAESKHITAMQDWEFVEFKVSSPPPGATRAYLRLVLEGQGSAWFDDISLESSSKTF